MHCAQYKLYSEYSICMFQHILYTMYAMIVYVYLVFGLKL